MHRLVWRSSFSASQLGLGNDDSRVENAYQCAKDMYKAGIPMIVGSDSSGQMIGSQFGLGVHMEIHAMVHKAGMDVVDVLKGATSLIANRFGFNDRCRIEVGRKAGLIIIQGDVREFLAKEENLCLPVCGVWRDGVIAKVYEDVMS
jgi:imidazolonepropionase-like amidohydrolase